MEFGELINYILCLDQGDFQLKGDEQKALVRPNITVFCVVNGTRFEDTKAIIIEQQKTTIYYGPDMVEQTFTEILEFEIEGYPMEMMYDDAPEQI